MTINWHQRLLDLRADLEKLEASGNEARGTVELDQSRVGRLSRMDALQAQAMDKAIALRRQQMQARLSAALARLAAGEFGYCLECGEEIAVKRLEIDPTTACCTKCLSERG